MNRVKLLSEQVSNQIAAGEVIERPASVVKELVENALDARAERIVVEIANGGRTLIRVSDDGVGMSQDDALMSLERHATSKIRVAEDLSKIDTMGFRGEAVPSIASVSRMTIVTREREESVTEGTEINISGGKILAVKAAGSPPGTSIEVRNLFFNLPARRKFLRSVETERGHIQHYVALIAMAYPKVGLTYIQDGKTVFQFPAGLAQSDADAMKLLRDRMRLLYGAGDELVEVDRSINYDATPDEDIAQGAPTQMVPLKLWGVIGAPGVSRSVRDRQHVFVNRRPVDNKTISFALAEAYQNALMKGRYPVCCLFLEIDPAEVDVNIHPSKREVKFHKEQAVRRIVARILRSVLEDYSAPHLSGVEEVPVAVDSPLLTEAERELLKKKDAPVSEPLQPALSKELSSLSEQRVPSSSFSSELEAGKKYPVYPAHATARMEEAPALLPTIPQESQHDLSYPGAGAGTCTAGEASLPLLAIPLRYLGVLHRLYILFESNRGLVLVDQHAAHERVLFERLMSQAQQGKVESQQLLLSETLELGMRDASMVKQRIPVFNRLGIGIHEFGERTFLLDALPPFVKGISAKKFILDLLDDLRTAGRELVQADLEEEAIASHACRLAVKANDVLNHEEIQTLMNDLHHCKMPYTCPHGRPTIIEINDRELEKKFRRIV